MKVVAASLSAVALCVSGSAWAQPSPGEAMEICVLDVTQKSEQMGQDPSKAKEICECLVPKIGENMELVAEIEANRGLPGPDDASEDLKAVIESCLPKEA